MELVRQLGYIGVEASDMARWEAFATGVLGMVVSERSAGGFNLRLDDYQRRFFVAGGEADDVTALGFEVDDGAALAQLRQRLEQAGVETAAGDDEALAARGVAGLFRCADPSGVPLEFYHGPEMAGSPFRSDVVADGFVAGEQGVGHVVVTCTDPEACEAFYLDTLGFRLSDTIVLRFGERSLRIVFTHVNARHHTLAFSMPMPKNVHHFMVQARSIDDVGRAFDRAQEMGLEVTQQLGRHSNDRMLSFYARTPSGFEFEFGADAIEIRDEAQWQPVEYDRGSLWGHRPPPRPAPSAPPPAEIGLPEGQYLSLAGGHNLHYLDLGGSDGDGDAVVVLHGSGQGAGGWSNFKQNVPALREAGYRVIVPNLIGFGRSDKPADATYSLDLHRQALAQLIEQLGLQQVVLVGNSLGGALALYYALEQPERVASLVLLAPGGVEPAEVYQGMPGLQAMFRVVMADSPITPDDLRDVLRLQLYDAATLDEAVVAERYPVAREQPKAVWTTMQVPYMGDRLGRLQCPLLVFWGEQDQFLPVSGADVIRTRRPDAEVVVVPECGHWVMVEHARLFNRDTLAFLDRQRAR